MNKVNKLTLTSSDYPPLLKEIADPPPELFVRGDVSLLSSTIGVGVIGSRKASHYGRGATYSLIQPLAPYNVSIISGLALGIDSVAHKAALESNIPTIAVLPCGIESVYPSSHASLADTIIKSGGVIVSEFGGKARPMKHQFIQRNRVISGLSSALLVVEASQKSGTLHTVRFALEQGRPVLAVPGNITQPRSSGTNSLIAQGARIATSYQDIADELGITQHNTQHHEVFGSNKEEAVILKLLQAGNDEGQLLLEMSGLDSNVFLQTMTMLEISGKIKPIGANRWSVR